MTAALHVYVNHDWIFSFTQFGHNFMLFNDLFGPLNFTILNLKRRPAITSPVSYDLGSCPFLQVILDEDDEDGNDSDAWCLTTY